MTDKTHRIPLTAWLTLKWAELRARARAGKAKADDNIERSEPETFLASVQDWVFGMFIAAAWMMIAYAFMTDQITAGIASLLADMSGTFDHRLALLTSVFVLFAQVIVIFGVALNRNASHDDIVDVVNDLGEQIDERFVELEERITQNIALVNDSLQDVVTITPIMNRIPLTDEEKMVSSALGAMQRETINKIVEAIVDDEDLDLDARLNPERN